MGLEVFEKSSELKSKSTLNRSRQNQSSQELTLRGTRMQEYEMHCVLDFQDVECVNWRSFRRDCLMDSTQPHLLQTKRKPTLQRTMVLTCTRHLHIPLFNVGMWPSGGNANSSRTWWPELLLLTIKLWKSSQQPSTNFKGKRPKGRRHYFCNWESKVDSLFHLMAGLVDDVDIKLQLEMPDVRS